MFARPIVAISLIVLGLIVLLGLAAVVVAVSIDLRPFLEQRLSKSLDRRVSIGALKIDWGNPLKLEIRDVHLANAAWGSTPDMVQLERLSAEIDSKALFSGVLRYHKLIVIKPVIVLERNPEGIGNWRFGSTTQTTSASGTSNSGQGLAVVPKNRRQFPILLDFVLQDGLVTYRTYSGNVLRIGLDQVMIKSTGDDQLVDLDAVGSYNDAKLELSGQTQSFLNLRDGTVPFGTTFSLKRQSGKLDFTGTMMEPLDFEGVKGPVRIKAEQLNDILGIFGAKLASNPSFTITGDLTRQGNLWNLMDAKGEIATSTFTGDLTLLEGNRGESDDIKTALTFDRLDLGPLLQGKEETTNETKQGKGNGDWMALPLDIPDKAAPRLAAKISTPAVKYGDLQLGDFSLDGKLGPGEIKLNQSTFTLIGAKINLSGSLGPAKKGSQLAAEMRVDDADAAKLAGLLGSTGGELSGKADGRASLKMSGETLRDALKASDGGVVLSMSQGRISRDLLEKAATDLRTLFRKGKGTAQVSCLLGVMRLKNGVGTLEPLRLRTPEATLNGAGRIDLLRQSLDLTLQSEAKSTGFFAMDLPLRISGNWRKPRIDTSSKSVSAKPADDSVENLPAALQQLVQQNACSQ